MIITTLIQDLNVAAFAFGINYFGICVTLVKQAHERLSVSLGG